MPTALWNDLYVVPLPLTEVVPILEVALTLLEVVLILLEVVLILFEGGSNEDGSEAEDESHRCGCSSDSDCFELEATLPDNLTAICEGNVCVEGCRFGMKIGIGLQITCFQGGHLLFGLERDVLKLKCEHVQLL